MRLRHGTMCVAVIVDSALMVEQKGVINLTKSIAIDVVSHRLRPQLRPHKPSTTKEVFTFLCPVCQKSITRADETFLAVNKDFVCSETCRRKYNATLDEWETLAKENYGKTHEMLQV